MKLKLILLLFIGHILYGYSQESFKSFLNNISIEKIKSHVDTLASETMQGRYSGEPGQKLAAKYISNEFVTYGLKPYNTKKENPYYQEFELYRYYVGSSEIYYNNQYYWAPVFLGSKNITDSISSNVLFTGYAEAEDLKKMDIDDKSIFFFSESVKKAIDKSKEISGLYNIHTFVVGIPFEEKFNKEIFNDTVFDFQSFKELYYYYTYHVTAYKEKSDFNSMNLLNKAIPGMKIDSEKDIKIIFVPENIAEGLFEKDIKELHKIAQGRSKLSKLKSSHFSYMVYYSPLTDTIKTENVIGFIDSESNETVIVGAHYDHVGVNYKNEINYGADDNASGTSAILSIAELLSDTVKNGAVLNKDIIFIAYSAEELGLHGSEYYTNHPLVPLSETRVVFNLDMIGRNKDDKEEYSNTVFLLEWEGGKNYTQNVFELNEEYTKLLVDDKPDRKNKELWTYGSDHYSFSKNNVSSIAYFTALHKDYHTPRDTPDKLNYDKLRRIIQLVFLNVWDISTHNSE